MSPQSELQEVLGADEEAGPLDDAETASLDGSEKGQENIEPPVQTALLTASAPAAQAGGPRDLQTLLEDRIHNYREAAASAKEAGEAAKARRCERGLKVSWATLGSRAGRSGAEVRGSGSRSLGQWRGGILSLSSSRVQTEMATGFLAFLFLRL